MTIGRNCIAKDVCDKQCSLLSVVDKALVFNNEGDHSCKSSLNTVRKAGGSKEQRQNVIVQQLDFIREDF